MKKGKLTTGLITGFIAALALCACDVTEDKNHIVTYKDYGNGAVSIDIDSFYESYRKTTDGISKIYDAVLESVIRYQFQSGKMDGKTDKTLAELKEDATNKVKGKKEDASDNAETNHTSYDTEWQSILDSYGCEDENELYQHFLYEVEKEQVEDWYLKESYKRSNNKTLISEFIGVDKDGASTDKGVAPAYPYHIRHILASISDSGTNFYNNVITQDEAKTLWKIVGGLVDTDYTFGDVALRYSGDSGSAAEYGDVGIMTTSTSFVNEFKLGIYAYDALINHNGNQNQVINKGLGLNDTVLGRDHTVKEYLLAHAETNDYYKGDTKVKDAEPMYYDNGTHQKLAGLSLVPFKAFFAIDKFSEVTKDEAGFTVNNGNEHYYPRNIYWNNYVNLHEPFLVTNDSLKDESIFTADDNTYFNDVFNGSETRFVDSSTLGIDSIIGTKKVLCDNKGRIIIGARGQYGVHFMIMQKSIFDYCEGGTSHAAPSLDEYYTPYIPGDANYPKYNNGGVMEDKKNTYIDYYSSNDTSVFNTRASKVKEAIKGFDETYSYRIYKDFIGDGAVYKFNGVADLNLGTAIENYIKAKVNNNYESRKDSLATSWRSYLELINLEYASRIDMVDSLVVDGKAGNDFKLIPEGCAIGFKKANKTGAEWEEGGYCYAK